MSVWMRSRDMYVPMIAAGIVAFVLVGVINVQSFPIWVSILSAIAFVVIVFSVNYGIGTLDLLTKAKLAGFDAIIGGCCGIFAGVMLHHADPNWFRWVQAGVVIIAGIIAYESRRWGRIQRDEAAGDPEAKE